MQHNLTPGLKEHLASPEHARAFRACLQKALEPTAPQPQPQWAVLDVPDEVPVPTALFTRLLQQMQEQPEFAVIQEVLRSGGDDLATRAALIAHLHDRYAVPSPGLRQLFDWGPEPGVGTGEHRASLAEPTPIPSERRKSYGNRLLLAVHGTFVSCERMLSLVGGGLRQRIDRTYAAVLAFDHYTLSQSPRKNGAELHSALLSYLRQQDWMDAEIDILCHSRGGLVVRELVEKHALLASRPLPIRRVHFVAAPNAGTHLACPANVVDALTEEHLLARAVAHALGSTAFAQLLSSLDTPLEVDDLLRYIPGLAAMNPESAYIKDWLNDGSPSIPIDRYPHYSAAAADFQPDGITRHTSRINLLWSAFEQLLGRDSSPLRNAAMDLIFQDQPNDLVVDTESVWKVHRRTGAYIPPERLLAFVHPDRLARLRSDTDGRFLQGARIAPHGGVEHSSYFGMPEWIAFVAEQFALR